MFSSATFLSFPQLVPLSLAPVQLPVISWIDVLHAALLMCEILLLHTCYTKEKKKKKTKQYWESLAIKTGFKFAKHNTIDGTFYDFHDIASTLPVR